ncbi:B3 domain-containing protein LOC_Os12g40080 isoform X3 [Prunus persica]|uniref:B3 domain-containing protein LOC_Os12g40080 isoform X3 n=1 Tax=Prunus persica TaxID=3760 RepID=UPI0009AB84A3|nr:B3 domain-containing protein LOC_Os12g40080 isoform X3 [Prunus persica]
MTSLRREIDNPTKRFSSTTPYFFMMIPKGASRGIKLRIPNKFLMKCGDDLSNPVFLNVPSGSKWKMELRRWDGDAWFDKGWSEFFEFYSLDNCHSLVFRYEGNSKFNVCIFDQSFKQIDYALKMPKMKETNSDDSGDVTEILDKSLPRPRKSREKSPLQCLRPHKKARTSSRAGKVDFYAKRHGGGKSITARFPKRTEPILGSPHPSTTSEKAIALQRAKAFKSDNPFFMVSMGSTNIDGYHMSLPAEFVKEHFNQVHDNAILCVSGERAWPVKLGHWGRGRIRFQSGWGTFLRDNHLEIGDVCVFELISNIKPLFDVVFFHATEAPNCTLSPDVDGEQTIPKMEETYEDDGFIETVDDYPSCPKTRKKSPIEPQPHKKSRTCSIRKAESKIKDVCGASRTRKFLVRGTEVPRRIDPVEATGKDIALQRAKAFKSEYPFCWVLMHHSYIHRSYLRLPAKFSKEHINWTHDNIVLHVPNGRTWPVKLGQDARGRVIYLSGWTTFVRDNNLEVGDVCVFELINDVKPLFDVVLFCATKAANCTLSPDDFPPVPRKTREKPPHISLERAVERANSFASKYPFFKIAMHATYIHGHHMNLSSSFVKENLNQTSTYAILRVSDGRTWSVKLDQYGDARTRFQGGWMDFVRENSLVIGDVCVFVLVNNIKPLFDVAFYRTKSKAAHCTLNN